MITSRLQSKLKEAVTFEVQPLNSDSCFRNQKYWGRFT